MYGTDVRVARIFNTYGPGMDADDGRVIPNFVVQALNNDPITVYGDGSQTRSFCYISDMIDGLKMLCAVPIDGPINLGNPQPISMLQLAHTVKDLVGSSSRIEFRPLPVDDPTQRKPNIAKAQSVGWNPTVILTEGLSYTIAYFDRQLAA
jgi:UDP-glucuronate decarboxylase